LTDSKGPAVEQLLAPSLHAFFKKSAIKANAKQPSFGPSITIPVANSWPVDRPGKGGAKLTLFIKGIFAAYCQNTQSQYNSAENLP
jgi:hypothetical protein